MRFTDAPLYVRQIIIASFIFTFVLAIIGLFAAIRLCKKRRYILTSAATLVLAFAAVFLTMNGNHQYRCGRAVFEPSFSILKMPFWMHCAASVLLLAGAITGLVGAVLWNKKYLSPVSIKESLNKLPAGLCFYEPSGLVRLINTEMHRICVLATGKALLDGAGFWRKLTQGDIERACLAVQTGDKPIVAYPDGQVVSFKRYTHNLGEKSIYEIVAVDITERYCLTRELEQKCTELQQINRRLVAYGNNVVELTKEKELLAAKIRIHDDMGKLLLATKRRINEPMTDAEKKEFIVFWQAEIAALKRSRPRQKKNNLQVITEAARLVGVAIDFHGELPKADSQKEKILVAAMHECLTNTVSHANGKTMTVRASSQNGPYTIRITNDGEKPKGKIVEGGGLSGLRALVERENGRMTVNSAPYFELIIEMP